MNWSIIIHHSFFWPLVVVAGIALALIIRLDRIGMLLLRLVLPAAFVSKLSRSFELAVRSLWLHKLRAFLSVLGIIIGTSAVITLMAFGEGSMQDALDDIKRQGATNIIARSVKPPDDSTSPTGVRSRVANYGLTWQDYARFTTIDGINRHVPMRIFPQTFRFMELAHNGRLVATTPEYADVNKLELAVGRFLLPEDGKNMRNVCVVAHATSRKLFPYGKGLGESIKIGPHNYEVIGIIKDRMPTGGSGGSQAAEVFNDDIYIPIETCKVRYGSIVIIRAPGSFNGEKIELNQITMTVNAEVDSEEGRAKVRAIGNLIRDMLLQHHYKVDWALTIPLDKLEEAERAKDRYTRLLALIASISLFVGGIGIMNIMLATVTERTREIGIRRALGAKQKDITLQFLVEAVVQTTIGGAVGVAVGLTAVFTVPVLSKLLLKEVLPAKVHVPSIFLALGVSIVVGVLFGWYPAQRAAKLDPIEALRHE